MSETIEGYKPPEPKNKKKKKRKRAKPYLLSDKAEKSIARAKISTPAEKLFRQLHKSISESKKTGWGDTDRNGAKFIVDQLSALL